MMPNDPTMKLIVYAVMALIALAIGVAIFGAIRSGGKAGAIARAETKAHASDNRLQTKVLRDERLDRRQKEKECRRLAGLGLGKIPTPRKRAEYGRCMGI